VKGLNKQFSPMIVLLGTLNFGRRTQTIWRGFFGASSTSFKLTQDKQACITTATRHIAWKPGSTGRRYPTNIFHELEYFVHGLKYFFYPKR
jgi:hypothetical protein